MGLNDISIWHHKLFTADIKALAPTDVCNGDDAEIVDDNMNGGVKVMAYMEMLAYNNIY